MHALGEIAWNGREGTSLQSTVARTDAQPNIQSSEMTVNWLPGGNTETELRVCGRRKDATTLLNVRCHSKSQCTQFSPHHVAAPSLILLFIL